MVKNKLESKFSKAIKEDPMLWGMKLQNNPLAHTNTPGDFLLSYYTTGEELQLNIALVECKQVSWKNGEPQRLNFKRLKQHFDLLTFKNFRKFHHSYYLIAYLDERFFENADVFLVPVGYMDGIINSHTKQSLNRADAKRLLNAFKINITKEHELLEKLTKEAIEWTQN